MSDRHRKELEERFTLTLVSEWDPVLTVNGGIVAWVPSSRLQDYYLDAGLPLPWERNTP